MISESGVSAMKIINGFYVVLLVMVFSFQSFAQKPPEVPLRDIFFNDGDFSLREDAKPVLRENAEFLIMNPEINVVVVGYCNSDEDNLSFNLGQKRAEATKTFLISQGLESQRISLSTECDSDHSGGNIDPELLEVKLRLDSRVHLKPALKYEQGVL